MQCRPPVRSDRRLLLFCWPRRRQPWLIEAVSRKKSSTQRNHIKGVKSLKIFAPQSRAHATRPHATPETRHTTVHCSALRVSRRPAALRCPLRNFLVTGPTAPSVQKRMYDQLIGTVGRISPILRRTRDVAMGRSCGHAVRFGRGGSPGAEHFALARGSERGPGIGAWAARMRAHVSSFRRGGAPAVSHIHRVQSAGEPRPTPPKSRRGASSSTLSTWRPWSSASCRKSRNA